MNRIVCFGIALFLVLIGIASININKTAIAGHSHHPFIHGDCHGASYGCDGCYGSAHFSGYHHDAYAPVGYGPPIQSMYSPIQTPYAPIQTAAAPPIQTGPIQVIGSPIQGPAGPIQKMVSPIQTAPAPIQAAVAPPIQKVIPPVQAVPTPIQKQLGPIQSKRSPIQVPTPIQASPVLPIQKIPAPIQAIPSPIQTIPSPIQKMVPIQSAALQSVLEQSFEVASIEIPVVKRIFAAFFNVNVPEDAEIYVNGHLTQKTGRHRTFKSNVVEDVDYQFEVRAEWVVDGQIIEQTKTMTLRAGQKKLLNFDDATDNRLTLLNR